MKLQKKNSNGSYVDDQDIANPQVTIPANGLIKLDTGKDNLGNQAFSGWTNLTVVVSSAGDYRVYARFEAYGQVVENFWEFEVV